MLEKVYLYKTPILFGFIGIFLFVLAFYSTKGTTKHTKDSEDITVISKEKLENQAVFVVDIQGAIAKPGIYEIDSEARIGNLIDKAGGFTDDVDDQWIAKNLNQASKVTDGMKLYIPKINVEEYQNTKESPSNPENLFININTASASQLETLPGIGKKRAQDIIANRPYGSTDELHIKDVIGDSLFNDIKDSITVY